MSDIKTLDYHDWIEKYKPLAHDDVDETLIDFCWSNPENAPKLKKAQEENKVWTKLDCYAEDKDGDEVMVIASGKHFVNRMEYYITEVPYTEEIEVL